MSFLFNPIIILIELHALFEVQYTPTASPEEDIRP